jgi:hypothetical protein
MLNQRHRGSMVWSIGVSRVYSGVPKVSEAYRFFRGWLERPKKKEETHAISAFTQLKGLNHVEKPRYRLLRRLAMRGVHELSTIKISLLS